jgi:hypothetical protein
LIPNSLPWNYFTVWNCDSQTHHQTYRHTCPNNFRQRGPQFHILLLLIDFHQLSKVSNLKFENLWVHLPRW